MNQSHILIIILDMKNDFANYCLYVYCRAQRNYYSAFRIPTNPRTHKRRRVIIEIR